MTAHLRCAVRTRVPGGFRTSAMHRLGCSSPHTTQEVAVGVTRDADREWASIFDSGDVDTGGLVAGGAVAPVVKPARRSRVRLRTRCRVNHRKPPCGPVPATVWPPCRATVCAPAEPR
jgi:hypothetical protein